MSARVLTRPRLHLPEVTLAVATSIAIEPTAAAIVRSVAQVEFAATLWLSDEPPPASISSYVEWRKIPRLRSRADYSRFMLNDLSEHVASSHVLCVQWDGFVLDTGAWSPEFLDYDYIGAPWPHFHDSYVVGNGGFSLRSKKLLQASRLLAADGDEAEDVTICRRWRPVLEKEAGIRFAPPDLAARFSYERGRPTDDATFGFHGMFNLVDLMSPAELSRLITRLEPTLLKQNEHREVLRWAFRRRYWGILWEMAKKSWWHSR